MSSISLSMLSPADYNDSCRRVGSVATFGDHRPHRERNGSAGIQNDARIFGPASSSSLRPIRPLCRHSADFSEQFSCFDLRIRRGLFRRAAKRRRQVCRGYAAATGCDSYRTRQGAAAASVRPVSTTGARRVHFLVAFFSSCRTATGYSLPDSFSGRSRLSAPGLRTDGPPFRRTVARRKALLVPLPARELESEFWPLLPQRASLGGVDVFAISCKTNHPSAMFLPFVV